MGVRYDLHTHSLISDGTTQPSEIAAEASSIGLAGFSLTDHDTIDGWDEARAAAAEHGIDFLPGIEITTRHHWESQHLLGYGIDPDAQELFDELGRVRTGRFSRARRMVDLIALDYAISWDRIVEESEATTVGRPHIADALVDAGYFEDRSAVFDAILHPASPYYVPTYAIDTVDAIRLVRAAGGVAVLAHPAARRHGEPVSTDAVREFAEAGLWGIELEHPENRKRWLPELRAIAEELGLVVTGSSDYHGAGKPNRLGECTTPGDVVDRIREIVATPR